MVWWLAAGSMAGCGGCGEDAAVAGPHPYVRCALAEPEEGEWSAGGLTLRRDARVLTVTAATTTEDPSFWVFSASTNWLAHGQLPEGPAIVLGGYARDEAGAERFAEAMGDRLVLLVPGGLDQAEALEDAMSPSAIDLRGVHRVVLPHGELVVVPGAEDGRYALGDGSCGFGPPDLEQLEATFDGEVDRRWWLSWSAPRGSGADLGYEGAPSGSEALAALGERLGVAGGLFAFPRTQAGRPTADLGTREVPAGEAAPDLALAVPLLGEVSERADESRDDGRPIRVTFTADGIRWSHD